MTRIGTCFLLGVLMMPFLPSSVMAQPSPKADWHEVSAPESASIMAQVSDGHAVYMLTVAPQSQLFVSNDSGRHWKGTKAPGGLKLFAVGQDSLLLVDATLLFSSDQGANWTERISPTQTPSVGWDHHHMLYGYDLGVLKRSSDFGLSWSLTPSATPKFSTTPLLYVSAEQEVFISGIQDNATVLFRSKDGGESWDSIPMPFNYSVQQIISANDALFVSSLETYASVDDGQSWRQVSVDGIPSFSLSADKKMLFAQTKNRTARYGQSNGSLYESRDSGQSWEPIFFLDSGRTLPICSDATGNLYSRFYRKIDTGWVASAVGTGFPAIHTILSIDSLLLSSTSAASFRTVDFRKGYWHAAVNAEFGANGITHQFGLDSAAVPWLRKVYATLINFSQDFGKNWQAIQSFEQPTLPNRPPAGFAALQDGRIFTGGRGFGYYSDDRAFTMKVHYFPIDTEQINVLAALSNILLSISTEHVYKYSDLTKTWSDKSPTGVSNFEALNSIDNLSGTEHLRGFLLGTRSGDILKSTDEGETWSLISHIEGSYPTDFIRSKRGDLYMSTRSDGAASSGVLRSEDHGKTWWKYNEGLQSPLASALPEITELTIVSDSLLVANTLDQGIFYTAIPVPDPPDPRGVADGSAGALRLEQTQSGVRLLDPEGGAVAATLIDILGRTVGQSGEAGWIATEHLAGGAYVLRAVRPVGSRDFKLIIRR